MRPFYQNPAATRSLSLLCGDMLLGFGAFYLGSYIRFSTLQEAVSKYNPLGLRAAFFVLVLLFCSFFLELYNQDKNLGRKETILLGLAVTFLAFFALSALYYLLPFVEIGRGMLIFSLAAFGMLQSVWHIAQKFFLRLPGFSERVLIFGTGSTAGKIGDVISYSNGCHILKGYITCPPEMVLVPASHVIGNGNGVYETAVKEKAHKIVISLSERRGALPLRDIMKCKLSGIDVLDAPAFYEQMTGKLLIEDMKPSSFIFSSGFRITAFMKVIKRIFDVVLAAFGLVIVLPVIPILALIIKLDSPGPVFYRQERLGEGEKRFILYKFRSMKDNAESGTGAVWAQKNDGRITRVGRFFRKTRLDEIPQLFNVFRGDMSFVGPRPERPEFVEELNKLIPYYSERHFVKPGITGWAQIKYPYGSSVEDAIEKLRYDLYYIKHLSLLFDLLIVVETIKVVFFGKGGR